MSRGHDVLQAPLDPEAPGAVEATDVGGAVPLPFAVEVAFREMVGVPEPVVQAPAADSSTGPAVAAPRDL